MIVSEIVELEGEIIHDSIFLSVGHLHSRNKKRLVPINSCHDLKLAMTSDTIAGLIIPEEIPVPKNTEKGIIIASNPMMAALKIQKKLIQNSCINKQPTKIHPSVYVHPSAIISDKDVVIEKNVKINEHVIISEGSVIERNTIIGPNTIVGSISKPVNPDPALSNYNPSGSVLVKQGVVIHAHCCIEKSWFQDTTIIGQRCHIDNLVTINQGAVVGDFSLITANSQIGDYAIIGMDCWVGLRSIIHPGVSIGDSCYVTLGSRVTKDIAHGMVVKDNWAIKRERFKGVIT